MVIINQPKKVSFNFVFYNYSLLPLSQRGELRYLSTIKHTYTRLSRWDYATLIKSGSVSIISGFLYLDL
jgi:hypothetical protein